MTSSRTGEAKRTSHNAAQVTVLPLPLPRFPGAYFPSSQKYFLYGDQAVLSNDISIEATWRTSIPTMNQPREADRKGGDTAMQGKKRSWSRRLNSPHIGCEICHSEQLEDLIEQRVKEIQIRSVHGIFRTPWNDCPFCNLLARAIRQHCDGAELNEAVRDHRIVGRIFYHKAESDLYLRPDGIQAMYQIKVHLEIQRSYHGPSSWDDADVRIDVLKKGQSNAVPTAGEAPVMQRRLLPATFDTGLLREWLRECEQNHKHTKPSRSAKMLEELIELGRFRLIDVKNAKLIVASSKPRYLTLSYVWGLSPYCHDFERSSSATSQHLEFCGLPKTLKDAISVVQDIGEQYLWIDAICIDQSDPVDKEQNIAAMSSIFGSSILTIVAANGADADAGLSRVQTSQRVDEQSISVRTQSGTIDLVFAMPSLQTILEDRESCIWNSRGWTYQEYMLSPRCAFFTKDEVFFGCPFEELREAYTMRNVSKEVRIRKATSVTFRSLHDEVTGSGPLHFPEYEKLVERYTMRDLTHIGDKLNAFTALLDRFVSRSSAPYERDIMRCGLPLRFMYDALFWVAKDYDSTRIESDSRCRFAFPSWSWIGWTGQIQWWALYTRKRPPPLTFRALGSFNILATPSNESTYWKDWPFQPERCQPGLPTCITLHMWANVVSVRIDQQFSTNGCRMYSWDNLSEGRQDFLGWANVDRAHIAEYGTAKRLDAVYFGDFENPAVLLMHEVDGFHFRVSGWADPGYPFSDENIWERLMSPKYIRLR